ncbi:MAG: GCN5-related N-acetyltransferase [Bacillales bacterium]|jgi:predicted GNAT family acetyltransferase|nr:GCN5-related N-acetyltransferase [Bacillales bacterium]
MFWGVTFVIRKLSKNDHEQTLNFLLDETIANLFIIGDILAFGYDEEFQELWGDFDDDNSLRGLLLKYHSNFIPYAKGDFDIEGFAKIILELKPNLENMYMIGKPEITEQFEKFDAVPGNEKIESYLCEYTEKISEPINFEGIVIKKGGLADIPRILELRKTIECFDIHDGMLASMELNFKSGTARHFYIEDNDKIVASVSTSAENKYGATIVGVQTNKNYRNRGYASALMTKLITELDNEGKKVGLFYYNPVAGSIYKKLGFRDISKWNMYK